MLRPEPAMLNKTESLRFNPYNTVHMINYKKRKVKELLKKVLVTLRLLPNNSHYSYVFAACPFHRLLEFALLTLVNHSYTHI